MLVFGLSISDTLAAAALLIMLAAWLLGPENDSWLESALMFGIAGVAVWIAGVA